MSEFKTGIYSVEAMVPADRQPIFKLLSSFCNFRCDRGSTQGRSGYLDHGKGQDQVDCALIGNYKGKGGNTSFFQGFLKRSLSCLSLFTPGGA